jgi:predicted metal-binding protein
MERILIVGCKRTMDVICVGCSRCLVALNRYEGAFERYKDQKAQLIGLTHCGDCPGNTLVPRLALMKLWNAPLSVEPTKIHLAPCVVHCQHCESIMDKLATRCRIEILKGAHPYQMESIFS